MDRPTSFAGSRFEYWVEWQLPCLVNPVIPKFKGKTRHRSHGRYAHGFRGFSTFTRSPDGPITRLFIFPQPSSARHALRTFGALPTMSFPQMYGPCVSGNEYKGRRCR